VKRRNEADGISAGSEFQIRDEKRQNMCEQVADEA
jgi:hypothetical protein